MLGRIQRPLHRTVLFVVPALAIAACCTPAPSLSVSPDSMEAGRWSVERFVLSGPPPSAYLESRDGRLALVPDARVRIGPVDAQIVEAGGWGLRVRLTGPLAVGWHDVVLHARRVDHEAPRAIRVWSTDGEPPPDGGEVPSDTPEATEEGDIGDLAMDPDLDGGCEASDCVPGSIEACPTPCGSIGARTCLPDCRWDACAPPPEGCNGLDDDCDGLADEGFPCAAGAPVGCTTACGSPGTATCDATCLPGPCPPPVELCGNALDDDCDGVIDQGCAPTNDDCAAAWRLTPTPGTPLTLRGDSTLATSSGTSTRGSSGVGDVWFRVDVTAPAILYFDRLRNPVRHGDRPLRPVSARRGSPRLRRGQLRGPSHRADRVSRDVERNLLPAAGGQGHRGRRGLHDARRPRVHLPVQRRASAPGERHPGLDELLGPLSAGPELRVLGRNRSCRDHLLLDPLPRPGRDDRHV